MKDTHRAALNKVKHVVLALIRNYWCVSLSERRS